MSVVCATSTLPLIFNLPLKSSNPSGNPHPSPKHLKYLFNSLKLLHFYEIIRNALKATALSFYRGRPGATFVFMVRKDEEGKKHLVLIIKSVSCRSNRGLAIQQIVMNPGSRSEVRQSRMQKPERRARGAGRALIPDTPAYECVYIYKFFQTVVRERSTWL